MKKIIIIGSGIAALSAAESIRSVDKNCEVLLISEEEYLPYYRLKLSKYLSKDFNYEDLYIHNKAWYEENNINLLLSKTVTNIDFKNKILYMGEETQNYTKLILACGSYSFIPPILGTDKKGVFTVKFLNDVLKINDYLKKNNYRNIAVIGGGLLGIECAYAFKEHKEIYNVNIIENSPRFLPRQLDEEGAYILEEHLKSKGLNLYKSAKIKSINGDDCVKYIELEDGSKIYADVVIISAGIRSNINFLNNTEIIINKGIVVDKYMKTNIDDVYAAGDCCEYNNALWGIWPVALEQGKIAGLNSIGKNTLYNEITPSNLLQVAGLNVFSAGDISDNNESLKFNKGLYTKIFIKEGFIKGAILIGDTKKGYAIKKAIEDKKIFDENML
ncbi:MAG: FAD-dependent oxidoreductase [Caloramator sp.]|nr:FAD-dependent oxidoreductase [Caloramator sp.]